MACAAGFTVLHVFHCCFVLAALGLIQVRMATVATLKHLNVYGVRECDVTDGFVFEYDVAGMAFVAVTGDAECLLAVMAGAAGLDALH